MDELDELMEAIGRVVKEHLARPINDPEPATRRASEVQGALSSWAAQTAWIAYAHKLNPAPSQERIFKEVNDLTKAIADVVHAKIKEWRRRGTN